MITVRDLLSMVEGCEIPLDTKIACMDRNGTFEATRIDVVIVSKDLYTPRRVHADDCKRTGSFEVLVIRS